MPIHNVDELIDQLESVDASLFGSLAASFQYLRDNVERFENGDIDLEDIPITDETSETVAILVMKSVQFGLMWEREYPDTEFDVLVDRVLHSMSLLLKNHPGKEEQFKQRINEFEKQVTKQEDDS